MNDQHFRGEANERNDWLTPPGLIELLGPFDFDPCCPPVMPWRTARVMISQFEKAELLAYEREHRKRIIACGNKVVYPRRGDGLEIRFRKSEIGWYNPPFSPAKLTLFVEHLLDHGNGLMVTPAKSTDTRWCQRLLEGADAVRFLDDRIRFCWPHGEQSESAWAPYLIAACGREAVKRLTRIEFRDAWPGVTMVKA